MVWIGVRYGGNQCFGVGVHGVLEQIFARRNLDQLENGMPMADVLDVFGPPQRMSASVSGYIDSLRDFWMAEAALDAAMFVGGAPMAGGQMVAMPCASTSYSVAFSSIIGR